MTLTLSSEPYSAVPGGGKYIAAGFQSCGYIPLLIYQTFVPSVSFLYPLDARMDSAAQSHDLEACAALQREELDVLEVRHVQASCYPGSA